MQIKPFYTSLVPQQSRVSCHIYVFFWYITYSCDGWYKYILLP